MLLDDDCWTTAGTTSDTPTIAEMLEAMEKFKKEFPPPPPNPFLMNLFQPLEFDLEPVCKPDSIRFRTYMDYGVKFATPSTGLLYSSCVEDSPKTKPLRKHVRRRLMRKLYKLIHRKKAWND